MGGNEIAGHVASGALGLFVIVKGLSRAIRGWNGDRKDDKIDKSTGNQIDVLEKENKELRETNTKLREDWQRLAKEDAALSARIQGLETQIKEQSEKITNLSRLIVHLVKVQGKDLPPDIVLSIISPLAEQDDNIQT